MPNIRKSWTGQIALGPILIDVVAKPATGKDERNTGFKRLCECHEAPFTQETKCPAGKHPTSDAAIKRGDKNLTGVVYGVEADDGSFVVIPNDTIEAIKDSTILDDLQIAETVPVATADEPEGFPLHLGVKAYYLAADKDGDANAAYFFAALHNSLAESGDVAVSVWCQREAQALVGIHAVGDTLMMTLVPFGAQTREPDPLCVAHRAVAVSAADQQATSAFLANMRSQVFDHDSYEDEAEPQRAEAIEKALKAAQKGRKQPAVKGRKKAAPKPTGSLADLLGKSVEAAKSGKASKSKAKPKSEAATIAIEDPATTPKARQQAKSKRARAGARK